MSGDRGFEVCILWFFSLRKSGKLVRVSSTVIQEIYQLEEENKATEHCTEGLKERIEGLKERVEGSKERIEDSKERIEDSKERIENSKERIEGLKERIKNTEENKCVKEEKESQKEDIQCSKETSEEKGENIEVEKKYQEQEKNVHNQKTYEKGLKEKEDRDKRENNKGLNCFEWESEKDKKENLKEEKTEKSKSVSRFLIRGFCIPSLSHCDNEGTEDTEEKVVPEENLKEKINATSSTVKLCPKPEGNKNPEEKKESSKEGYKKDAKETKRNVGKLDYKGLKYDKIEINNNRNAKNRDAEDIKSRLPLIIMAADNNSSSSALSQWFISSVRQ